MVVSPNTISDDVMGEEYDPPLQPGGDSSQEASESEAPDDALAEHVSLAGGDDNTACGKCDIMYLV